MEIFLEQIEEAKKCIKIADHLAYVTYPLVNDIKIINLITDHIFNSLTNSIDSLLNYERYYKRISNIPSSFENKFIIFKLEVSKRYNIPGDIILLIKDIKDIIETRKKNNYQFLRGNNIILCTDEFRTKTLNLKKVKDYINSTKFLVNKVNTIIGKNARRF